MGSAYDGKNVRENSIRGDLTVIFEQEATFGRERADMLGVPCWPNGWIIQRDAVKAGWAVVVFR